MELEVAGGMKPLPHDPSTERALLGAVLLDNRHLAFLRTTLPALYSRRHIKIAEAMLRLDDAGDAVEILALKRRLEDDGELALCGGYAYLAEITNGVPRSAHAEHYAEIVLDRARRRNLIARAQGLINAASNGISDRRLSELIEGFREDAAAGASFTWARSSFLEMVKAQAQPIPWLIEGLAARDEVVVLTAQPKEGKTWLLLQLALDAALRRPALGLFDVPHRCRVLWVDEEMGQRKLQRRFQRLAQGAGLTEEELQVVDQHLDIRPQQGLSLASPQQFDAFRRGIDETMPDLIIMDSVVALHDGEENSNTDRRRFYNRVLAPIKGQYGCAIILAAHPPLPTRDAPAGSRKRPRGGGDIVAQVDRSLWMESSARIKTGEEFTVVSVLETMCSREGGDLEPVAVTIDGPEDEPVTVHAAYTGSAAGQKQLGKIVACQREILHVLTAQPENKIYQPTLIGHCEERGYNRQKDYYPAMRGLMDQGQVEVLPPEGGKSGKWVRMLPEEEQ